MHMNRRFFLKGSAATIAVSSTFPVFAEKSKAFDTKSLQMDAVTQAQMLQAGELSAFDLAQDAITRIKRLNPIVNAVITPLFDEALERSRDLPIGPFQGVPYLLKDLIDFKGARTAYGSRMLKNNISDASHVFTQAVERAGLNILGKTNTPEFGLLATTEPLVFGPTANPWSLKHSAGGSSGGAAAAVASGMVAIAQGSDGGGSLRMPASCCGIFSLKPSRMRNVYRGRPALNGLAVKGHMSRTVRDSAALHAVTEWQGHDAPFAPIGAVKGPATRRLKIGMHMMNLKGNMPDGDVEHAIRATGQLCQDLGHTVEEMSLPIDGDLFNRYFLTLWSRVPAGLVDKAGSAAEQVLEPWTRYLAEYHKKRGAADFEDALQYMQLAEREMEKLFGVYDVVLSPVLSAAPVSLGKHSPDVSGDFLVEDVMNYVGYTPLYNGTGQPAMSVPLSWNSEGLPIGSHFAARLGDEQTLFELAYELEAAKPWKDKWAPHSAFHI